ncbi:MAG TPA: hypothetical protein VG755_15150 [Nannocystaceae bacterium]|nr:hypothetical protein [Nannocystaceae bacterium]
MLAARTFLLALLVAACTPASTPVEVEPAKSEPTPVEPSAAPAVADVPIATPTPAPIVAPEPTQPSVFASASFPKNVHAALVNTWSDHAWSVDIVDTQLVEGSALAKAIDELAAAHEASPEAEDGYFEHADLPAGHLAIPKGWKVGDTWTLLTRNGTLTRKAKGFSITIPAGSGTYHFDVKLGIAPKGEKGPAIAVRGSGMAPTIAKPEALPLATLGEGALAKIRKAARGKAEPEQNETLRTHPPKAKNVRVFAGRFPGGRTHAIFVSIVDDELELTPFSALLFARADGTIERVKASDAIGEMRAWAIVDLDGDGLDEIVYEDEYHEGWYLDLLYWQHEQPKTRTLTGDGI